MRHVYSHPVIDWVLVPLAAVACVALLFVPAYLWWLTVKW